MREGHCFTIEPMINQGVWKDQLWNDNWTVVRFFSFLSKFLKTFRPLPMVRDQLNSNIPWLSLKMVVKS